MLHLPANPAHPELVDVGDLHRARSLPLSFYLKDPTSVARALLGKVIVTECRSSQLTAAAIVEVEAYAQRDDPASHSARGMTRRNESMFATGGTCYVYLSYGINHCVNVVTGKRGQGDAVLIRAMAPLCGIATMAIRRGLVLDGSAGAILSLGSGPGKLTQALGINLNDDGTTFLSGPLRIVDLGLEPKAVGASRRIGISKGTDLPWRFFVAESPWLSRKNRVTLAK